MFAISLRIGNTALVRSAGCAALVCAMGGVPLHAAEKPGTAAANPYHVVAHFKLDGMGSTEGAALDAAARKLYVAQGDAIEVLNADSGEKVGVVASGKGVHGIAIVPELKRGFAANSQANSIAVFNTDDLKVVHVVPSGGKEPEAVLYDEGSKHVYAANGGSGSVTVMDAGSGKILATVQMGGRLRGMAASGYGRLYVAAEDKNVIHVVDTQTMKFIGDFPVSTGEKPYALSLDSVGRRLFVACGDGTLAVIDTDIGFTFEQLPIGVGASGSTFTFKPGKTGGWKGADFVATADGKLSFVKMDAFISYSSAGSLTLQPGIRTVVYDPKTHHLLVPAGPEVLVVGE